jgi:hypothetical protein
MGIMPGDARKGNPSSGSRERAAIAIRDDARTHPLRNA